MALFVRITTAERSANNGIRLQVELVDDTPNPDVVIETRDITLQFPPTGTNAEKRAAMRAEFDALAAHFIERRTTADANVDAFIQSAIGYRFPAA